MLVLVGDTQEALPRSVQLDYLYDLTEYRNKLWPALSKVFSGKCNSCRLGGSDPYFGGLPTTKKPCELIA